MNDDLQLFALPKAKLALPVPTRQRWQPLRLGLVELYHYDSEEFWFRDGHLLLRGNNGTGKSKVLSLTLPFLLDAQLKSSRIEPDGDSGKKMAWNLLMNTHDRRHGYAWIEFGRVGDDGAPQYLSLGAGLSAVVARPQVDAWFFMLEGADGGARINQDFWLTGAQRVVLTKERLRDALVGRGQVFDTAAGYRRAVDERLFRLGSKRYDALMDTLIQLRQPQLSRKPDETALSNALTEALPPLAPELLGDVADAFGHLEEDRRQLGEYQALAKVVSRFEARYRIYAGTQTRRQARVLRQAQTELDTASRARGEAQSRLEQKRSQEVGAQNLFNDSEVALARARARLDALRSDPTMQDANRLETAERESSVRQQAMRKAEASVEEAGRRLKLDAEETGRARSRMAQAESALAGLRRQSSVHAEAAGIASQHEVSPVAALAPAGLVELSQQAFDTACAELAKLVAGRREQIALLRRRHSDVVGAEAEYRHRQEVQDDKRLEVEEAAQRRTQADAEVERWGRQLTEDWDGHFAGLKQLQVNADARLACLTALADWTITLVGENPAWRLLQDAYERASFMLARRGAEINRQLDTLAAEQAFLEDERERLQAGKDTAPPLPYTRGAGVREARAGAPFWQLVDFCDALTERQRAGLEAALEAAGLLDAWVSPDGSLQAGGDDAPPLHDTQLLERPRTFPSLSDWLHVTVPDGCAIPADIVERVLSGCACADEDPLDCEAWFGMDGRFRLGAVSGAWGKADASYIGHAARATARRRRLAEIADRLAQLAETLANMRAMQAQLAQDRLQADEEWRRAPPDESLRAAHLAAAESALAARRASERLAEADSRLREAEKALTALCEKLAEDAADLRLPTSAAALPAVETALDHYRETQLRLEQAAHALRLALPEWRRQLTREEEARNDLELREQAFGAARIEAEEALARFDVLRELVGAKVEELQRQLTEAREAVGAGEAQFKSCVEALREAGEARAIANQQAETANIVVQQRGEARLQAILRLQQFAGTGLMSAALPDIELPDMGAAWTIDPALTLARRAEQELLALKDDDDTWARTQRQIAEELTELQRALGALGHQARADPSDWGFSVDIIYQNRRERPDQLARQLDEEIAQREELLTANERTVLENHLQAEIAAEIQRLLQAAERQVDAINRELQKRPTSTGVRYRLQWQPLPEEEGAPAGLDLARKNLFSTSADLWSAEDRRVIGVMLQQRIAAERERADGGGGKGAGGLLDQLARALDYRHWHRFRVERWQEGHWRKLSGPASSGERALGLTVPLFAAVASFYSQGGDALAPRLMLLDEAFAGIDDTARAHCMALIREFDLDFVITSEREWACYAELPGVAICQLQRREGIDAVFVSRWTWDGKAKAPQADPDRRFAPE